MSKRKENNENKDKKKQKEKKTEMSEYSVGYGRPPKRSQFKPGQSGNPSGRPKKIRTPEEDLEAELRARIPILEGGRQHKITKQRGLFKVLVNKALAGNISSAKFVLGRQGSQRSAKDNNLPLLLQEFREKNALHTVADHKNDEKPADKPNGSQDSQLPGRSQGIADDASI